MVKKKPKLTKNEENWQNPNRLMNFSKIWYVDAFQQKYAIINRFLIAAFISLFWQKTAKLSKNKENWQNPNSLVNLTEIWYVDVSQQKKML